MQKKDILLVALSTFALAWCGGAAAQSFPTRTVEIVVPFAAGGPTDVYARLLGQSLQQKLGKPVVVENKPGGGTMIGAALVARSKPDGQTLLFTAGAHVVAPLLRKNPPYDPIDDFEPVAPMVAFPFYLVVRKDFPASNIEELVAYSKFNPGQLTYGSVGAGTGSHLVAEAFNKQAGITAVHVPYKGASEFLLALQKGEVDYVFDSPGSSQPMIEAGRARGLAVTSTRRWPTIPNVPTLQELGLKDFEAVLWLGLLAPAQTPQPIVELLNKNVKETLADPDILQRLNANGLEPMSESPSEFRKRLLADREFWGKIITEQNLSIK